MSLLPKTNDNYIGIEIECIILNHYLDIKNIFKSSELDKFVYLGYDGSIDTQGFSLMERECFNCNENNVHQCSHCNGTRIITRKPAYELKVLVKQDDLLKVLTRLKIAFSQLNIKVNESCGLHVHLDMRNRNMPLCAKKLLNAQSVMIKSVPKSRRQNRFCLPVKTSGLVDISKISKYHAIHTEECMREYQTIEVRLHEGTLDCNEIYNWISFLINIIESNVANTPLRTASKFTGSSRKYLEERMALNA